VVDILRRASERIFAPLGIHPVLEDLGVDRCTAPVRRSCHGGRRPELV
jgi:hypothetical protein